MAKKKFLLILLVLVLSMAMLVGIVACDPKEEPTPDPDPTPTPSAYTVADGGAEIVSALVKQFNYDKSKSNFVWNFEVDAYSTTGDITTTYRISTKANISATNPNDTKISLGLSKVEGTTVSNVISVAVDNGYIYLETVDASGAPFLRKLNGFELGEVVSTKQISESNTSLINQFGGMLFSVLCQNASKSGNVITMTGNVDAVLELLPDLLGAFVKDVDLQGILDSTGIVDIVAGTIFTIKADITDIDNILIDINANKTDMYNAGIRLNKASLKGQNDVLVVPISAEVVACQAINAANFTLEGRFSMVTLNGRYEKTRTTFNYTIRTDLDPFSVMEIQEDGSVVTNLVNLFDQGMFYIDVFHDCADHGGYENNAFCNSRQSANMAQDSPRHGAKGSIITLAFDPANFGNNSFNISLNPNYILPADFINKLVGMDLSTMFSEYIGLTIAPEALIEFIGSMSSDTATTAATSDMNLIGIAGTLIDVLSNLDYSKNYLELVGDIVSVLAGITMDADNGLTIGNISNLFDILEFVPGVDIGGMGLGGLMEYIFTTGTDEIEMSVDNIQFADYTNVGYPAGVKYLFTNDYDGELKEYGNYPAAVDYEWDTVQGIDGVNRAKISADGVGAYDDNGNALPVSKYEAETLLTKGVVGYTALFPDGTTKHADAEILDVLVGPERDVDGNIKPGLHNIKLLTAMTDGGALSALLYLVRLAGPSLGINIDLTIPGNVIETTIFVTDIVGDPTFTQGEYTNNVVNDKVYSYDDKLNPYFDAEQEYDYKVEGSEVNYKKSVEKVAPIITNAINGHASSLGSAFHNYGTVNNSQLRYLGDFTMSYTLFGITHTVDIKMVDYVITKVNGEVNSVIAGENTLDTAVGKQLEKNQEFEFANNSSYTAILINEDGSLGTEIGVYARAVLIDPQENMEIDDRKIKFTEYGTYIVTGTVLGAPFTMKFVVAPASTIVAVPNYNMAMGSFNVAGDIFNVDVTRTGNIFDGNGIYASFKVSFDGVALTAEQFTVGTMVNGEFVAMDETFFKSHIAAYKPQQFYFKLATPIADTFATTVKVEAMATNTAMYGENATIVAFEVKDQDTYGFEIKMGAQDSYFTFFLISDKTYTEALSITVTDGTGVARTGVEYGKLMSFGSGVWSWAGAGVPAFCPEASYVIGAWQTTTFAAGIRWEGWKASDLYTITVTNADGVVLATTTNIVA